MSVIVVVGAGLIGLGIAFELAERGAEVRVLDQREPGRAASWAGAGMLAPYTEELEPGPFEAFCVASLARFPAFVERLRAVGGVDARLVLDGVLDVAYDDAGTGRLRRRAATLSARGVAARYVTDHDARALEPALSEQARGAVLVANEGCVDNRRLARALQAACAERGVRVEPQAGEVTLACDARRVLGVHTVAGFVAADAVVNACGAWSGTLGGVPVDVRVPVEPVKGQMCALAVPRGLLRRVVWVPGAYLVPRDDGRLLVGATVETARFDTRVTAAGLAGLLAAALAAVPALGDRAVVETWAGLRPGTPDGRPYVGPTSLGGYVVATGHYRNGILLTPATAAAIADILEGRDRPDLAAFAPQRAQELGAVSAKRGA